MGCCEYVNLNGNCSNLFTFVQLCCVVTTRRAWYTRKAQDCCTHVLCELELHSVSKGDAWRNTLVFGLIGATVTYGRSDPVGPIVGLTVGYMVR